MSTRWSNWPNFYPGYWGVQSSLTNLSMYHGNPASKNVHSALLGPYPSFLPSVCFGFERPSIQCSWPVSTRFAYPKPQPLSHGIFMGPWGLAKGGSGCWLAKPIHIIPWFCDLSLGEIEYSFHPPWEEHGRTGNKRNFFTDPVELLRWRHRFFWIDQQRVCRHQLCNNDDNDTKTPTLALLIGVLWNDEVVVACLDWIESLESNQKYLPLHFLFDFVMIKFMIWKPFFKIKFCCFMMKNNELLLEFSHFGIFSAQNKKKHYEKLWKHDFVNEIVMRMLWLFLRFYVCSNLWLNY